MKCTNIHRPAHSKLFYQNSSFAGWGFVEHKLPGEENSSISSSPTWERDLSTLSRREKNKNNWLTDEGSQTSLQAHQKAKTNLCACTPHTHPVPLNTQLPQFTFTRHIMPLFQKITSILKIGSLKRWNKHQEPESNSGRYVKLPGQDFF